MKKNVSELINEQIAKNPILSDEEVKEMTAPIEESAILDEARLNEEVAFIEEMYANCSTQFERDQISKIINEELAKRRNLNESKYNY